MKAMSKRDKRDRTQRMRMKWQQRHLRTFMTILFTLGVIAWFQAGVADARGFHGGGHGGFHGGARGGFHGGWHGGFQHHGFHGGGFGHHGFHGAFGYYGYPFYSYPSYGYPYYGSPAYSYPSYGSCYAVDAYGRCVSYAPNGGYSPY